MKAANYGSGPQKWRRTFKLIGKDILYVSFGLLVSMILAISVNPTIRRELFALLSN
jgi:hypothetical protein